MNIAEFFTKIVGSRTPIEFRAYDGSRAGTPGAPVTVEIRSPLALSYFASSPGELGLARAYVSGSLDVVGDMYTGLAGIPELGLHDIPRDIRWAAVRKLVTARLWWPISPPPQESRLHGRRHSKSRDSSAIQHHYDVSNTFYSYVLGPSMAYTCAVYGSTKDSLETAQYNKFDLVSKKLGLSEGMRLLDVGCGWGSMVIHAAKNYGVRALGVTLSREQAQWAQQAIKAEKLDHIAEVRYGDYRDIEEGEFDAISSIGLTEHIGETNLADYFRSLYEKLRPGGRLLNHCITRSDSSFASQTGPFINRYVFPDGELEAPGRLMTLMHDTGFEVRHTENLREHYALTLAAWCANLERNWDDAVREVGQGTARVWRLYMAGSQLGFERNSIQLHQMLGVKLDASTPPKVSAHVPLRPWF